MVFKKLEWLVLGAGKYWQVGLPFGMSITIRFNSKGKYLWEFGNYYVNTKIGTCATLEKAKENAEKAYQNYVIGNIAKC